MSVVQNQVGVRSQQVASQDDGMKTGTITSDGFYKKQGPEVVKLFSCLTQLSIVISTALKKNKISTYKEVSCFKSLSCCIYHAYKC